MAIYHHHHQPQAGDPCSSGTQRASQAHHPTPAPDGHNLWGMGAAHPRSLKRTG